MTLIDKLRDIPSEKLLHMRGEGDNLADEWHRAIEAVFAERGEALPPIPSAPVHVIASKPSMKGDAVLGVVIVLIAMVLGKILERSVIGLVAIVGMGVWFVAKQIRRGGLDAADREEEVATEKAEGLGMTELMRCAADGDEDRVREILAYDRGSVNARSRDGATALIYAARNGQAHILTILLDAGADRALATQKGLTARNAAQRYEHLKCAQLLEESPAT